MNQVEKENLLIKNYDRVNNLGVPIKHNRYPLRDGIQQKITLMSNVTGIFKNITFMKGIENTVNGSVANDLLDLYPSYFSVIKENGIVVKKGKENQLKDELKRELINELKENYKLVPIDKKDTKRDRVPEQELYNKATKEEHPEPKTESKYQKVK